MKMPSHCMGAIFSRNSRALKSAATIGLLPVRGETTAAGTRCIAEATSHPGSVRTKNPVKIITAARARSGPKNGACSVWRRRAAAYCGSDEKMTAAARQNVTSAGPSEELRKVQRTAAWPMPQQIPATMPVSRPALTG